MPQYIKLPNGSFLELAEGQRVDEALFKAAQAYPEAFQRAAPPPEPPKEQGSYLGDLGRSFASGAVGATGALTSVFGADNAASRYLAETGESLQKGLSTSRQAELQAQAARMKKAEESGSTWEEVKAGLLNVLEAPIQTTASALGSFAPMVATLPLAKIGLGARAIMAVRGAIGGAQGAGAVKQNVYEAVLQAELEDKKSPEEAQAAAARAQSYVGENLDQILLGGGLGVAAGATGAERLLPGGVRAQAGAAQQALTKRIGERAATGLTAAAGEFPLEGLQGGQERLAANLALQRTGRDVDAFTGVAGQATQEALAGGLGGAALGVALPDRSMSIAARKAEEERRAQEAKADADYKASDEYALDIASKYENIRTQLGELEAQKRKAKKGSPTFAEDVAHNKAIGEQQRALREEADFKELSETYKALGTRLAGIEAARFTEAERNAPTADKLYMQSPQETIPGLDAVEETVTQAEDVAPEKLMEQRQYLGRLLEDNQERMSTAAANADVNALKTLQQQRSLIKADAAALDERLKATGFVDTAGQTQQLQQDIAKAQQQLQKMAGPGFDPDKAAKLIERIERAQTQLTEVGGDQQGLDLGAPRKLSDPVAEADRFDTERTKRDLEERQRLMGQQRVTPEGQPDMFTESMDEVETQRREGETNFDYLDDIFEKALNQDVPAVAVPEGVSFSEKSQGLLKRLDALDARITSTESPQERQALTAERSAIAAASDADANLRAVYDIRSQAEDALLDLESAVDDIRTGTFFGGENIGAASTNREGLNRRAEEAKKAYIRAVMQEAAALRRIRNEKGVTADEALKAADQINTELDELINRGQAVRELEEVVTQPAQVRGTKVVSSAKTALRDVRPLEQRPFGKYRAALGTIVEGVEKTRRELTQSRRAPARAEKPLLKTQFAETEAKRVAEERGETATTLTGELRRRAEFVRNKMARLKGLRPAARDALNKVADVLDSGKPTRDLLDATETVVDSALRGQMPLERDIRAINDALAATTETPAEQRALFDTTTDRRRKDAEVGVIRKTPEAFNKVPAVVQARAAVDKAREEAKKIQRVINQKSAAVRALQAIRRRIADLENKINATLERTKPAARSADSFFSLSKSFVTRLTPAELANATPERRAEYAAALQVEAQYQAMRQEFDDKFKREGAASRAAVAPLQETKAVLDKQEKAFAKRISDLELALKDPALVAASKARAEAKDVLSSKEADLLAQVAEQRSDLQTAMDSTIAAIKPAFEAMLFATNPSVANAKKALDAAEASLDAAETALNKTKEQISSAGDVGGALRFALVYDAQRKAIEPARAALAPAREALEEAIAKAQVEYDKTALIAKAYQDGLVKVELAALNRLEKRLASVRKELGEASPEARAAQQEMAAQQKVLDIAEAKQREARELAAKQQSQYDERMQKGFGLPFTRRVEGAVVKSSSEVEAAAKEAQERFDRYFESWSRAQSKADRSQSKKAAPRNTRAIGPATRSQSAAPSAMRTGSAESREGQGRTQSDMRVTEARGEKQTDVAVSSKEMQEANRIAEELRKKTPAQKAKETREAEAVAAELLKSQRKEIDTDFSDEHRSVIREADYDDRPTTELPTTVKADVRAGRLEDALLRLQDEGSTPFVRELAKRVAPYLKGVTLLSNPNVVDSNGVPVEGLYVGKDMQVQISSATGLTEEAFLHEVVHPATLTLLRADPATLTPEQRQARQDLERLFAQIKADPRFNREYARFSVAEMASEVMSNNKLRNMLDERGFLQRMYDGFLRLLGFSPKTVSDQAVENIYKLFAPAQPIAAARVASVMRGIVPGDNAKYNANVPESMRKSFGGDDQRSKTFNEKLSTWALGLRVKTLDAWGAREALVQMGLSGKKLTEAQAMQTRIYMRLNSEVNRFVHQALLNGPLKLAKDEKGFFGVDVDDKKPSVMKVLETLRGAVPEIGNMKAVEEQFYKYMQIKRIEGDKRGFEVLNMRKPPTAQEIREQKEFIAKNPKIKQAFEQAEKEFREYNNGMLDFAHAAGVFTDKELAYFKNGNYVPFYRQTDDGNIVMFVGDSRRTIGNVIQQPQLKDLVGGEKDFLGFTESVMQNAQLLTRMSMQNLQARDVGYMVESLGLGTVVKGDGPANSIRFKRHGEARWVKLETDLFPKDIPAELLLQGLHGIKASVPTALKIAGIPTQILRTSIVRMPLYMIRQMIRDPLHAWMVTGLNFTPIVSSIKEMTKIRRGLSPTEMKLMRSGAVSSNVMTGDFNDASRTLRDLANQGGMSWSSAMQSLDNFALQGDTATRAVLYDKYREQGMSHFEAALGAAEVMNFSRRGTSTSLYMISTLIPFFNAQLQGLDSVWRTGVTGNTVFQDKLQVRQKLYQRAALMMGATLAYAVAMQDDEAYKNATPEERAMNWFIPVPGLEAAIRVPIPFEVGAVAKAIPELIFNAAFNDAESKDTLKGFRHVLGMSIPGDIPTIAKPIIESMANYSFFTKAPIESQRELGTIPAERYRPNTTELAKLMGQVGVSPLQVEHLVRGYTGSLGVLAMSLANPVLRPFNSDTAGEKAERLITETPFFGAAFQPNNGRGIVASVYADVEDWQQAAGTFKRLVTDGRQAEARAFADKYAREIALSSTGGSFQQAMGELASMRRAINSSPDLNAAEKRERLNEIDLYQRKLAEQVKEVARMAK